MAARKGMAIPPPSNQPKMDLSEQEEFEKFLTEVAEGEERNKRREDAQKRQEWEETKKYLSDQKNNRVQSGSGPQVARQQSGQLQIGQPVTQAKPAPAVSPRGPVLAGTSAGMEAAWTRGGTKPSGTGSPSQQRLPQAAPPPAPVAAPSDETPHPKLVASSNNSGHTLVPLAQAQAAQRSVSPQPATRTSNPPVVIPTRAISPQRVAQPASAANPAPIASSAIASVARPASGAQRAIPVAASAPSPTHPSTFSSVSPRGSGSPQVPPVPISPRSSGSQAPLSPRGDLDARRAELEEQKKRLAEMRQRVTENYGKTLIEQLKLTPHPEGGYFRAIYRSTEHFEKMPPRFGGEPRVYCTAIYYLLLKGQIAKWHRLKSDELWHFYSGDPVDVYVLDSLGLTKYTLGTAIPQGESFVLPVPHGVWFAAIAKEDARCSLCVCLKAGWSLVGCTMSPGFDYKDWELANVTQLCAAYPSHAEVINALSM